MLSYLHNNKLCINTSNDDDTNILYIRVTRGTFIGYSDVARCTEPYAISQVCIGGYRQDHLQEGHYTPQLH